MTGYESKRAAAQDKLVVTDIDGHLVRDARKPKKAQRQPLTDEEIADYLGDKYHDISESELRFFRLGEAATKKKNNGT